MRQGRGLGPLAEPGPCRREAPSPSSCRSLSALAPLGLRRYHSGVSNGGGGGRPSLLRSFRRRVPFATPAPAEPVCVIGDVHGCFALLEQLLAQLPADHRIILAGDYIDRGVDSAQVLRFLQAQPGLTCLMGNHEDMLLRFLQDPEREGPRWIRNGGQETLQSFGIDGVGCR